MVSESPEFQGQWKNSDVHSMSTQSSLIGIPSFQIELPPDVRYQMGNDQNLIKKWAEAII